MKLTKHPMMKRMVKLRRAQTSPLQLCERKDNDLVIQISKNEALLIRKSFKNVPIKRTVNKYYVESSPKVLRLLTSNRFCSSEHSNEKS